MYNSIVMMYASYVIDKKITIESCPPMLQPMIQAVVDEMTKKPEEVA